MIGRLRGTLAAKQPGEVLIDCGGVGYQAQISLQTFYALPPAGAPVELLAITNMRENALELFAFATAEERSAFNLLRGVSGIGPRLAISILSGIAPDELAKAVAASDLAKLVAVPGIGKKTAERVLLDLRGKMSPEPAAGAAAAHGIEEDAVSALVGLGYKRGEAERMVRVAAASSDGTIEDLIRRALSKQPPSAA
ncbi:MAG TPA: Holliday junction branch migration protein RuvA [Candidatus Limnocylindrales bacterium]|nr:Holliday junction branch migration protein RuvA [Candidatus Limnocylindrales bacterium]